MTDLHLHPPWYINVLSRRERLNSTSPSERTIFDERMLTKSLRRPSSLCPFPDYVYSDALFIRFLTNAQAPLALTASSSRPSVSSIQIRFNLKRSD